MRYLLLVFFIATTSFSQAQMPTHLQVREKINSRMFALKVPPAIIVAGEQDEIKDVGINYDKKLKEAGVLSSLFIQPKAGHLGPLFCAAHPDAKPAVDFVVLTLNRQPSKK